MLRLANICMCMAYACVLIAIVLAVAPFVDAVDPTWVAPGFGLVIVGALLCIAGLICGEIHFSREWRKL